VIRPRLKMARRAITQGQQQQQPGLREAPQVAPQSTQQQAPRTNAQANNIYRPGPTAANGPTSPAQSPSQVSSNRPGWMPVYAGARPAIDRDSGRSISGGPTGVTMENAGDKLGEWADRGYTGAVATPADPNEMPTQMNPEDATYADFESGGEVEPKSNEELINDMVRQYLEGAGNVDTTEQEALIEQRIKEQLNMDLMNQRASAGASGFEASGSLVGMDADIRRQAGMDAVDQILGARGDAQRDAYDRAMGAAGVNLDERRQAADEEMRRMQFEALNRWLESQGAETMPDEGGGGSGGDIIDGILNPDGEGVRLPGMNPAPGHDGEQASAGGLPDDVASSAFSSATEANEPPGGGDPNGTYTDENGTIWNLYLVDGTFEDGTWVKVRTNAASI
jgi:hypothetical protein